MLIASTKSSPRIIAWVANREMAPFYCPECDKEVILHKGQIRVPHFKHKPPITCPYGSGESEEHYLAKRSIYNALLLDRRTKNVDIEPRLNGARPDVYFELNSIRIAVELQKSSQSTDDIHHRTLKLNKLGIYVAWVIPSHGPRLVQGENLVCKVQSWHEYLQLMYFGRLYFWQEGKTIRAAHLGKYYRDVSRGNWVEDYEELVGDDLSGTDWYQENYDYAEYGGYPRYYKSMKTILWYPQELDIVDSFKYTLRQRFTTKRFDVPRCTLWMDRFNPWWPK